MSDTVLSVRGLGKRYAGVVALDGVDLEVAEGEVHAVIGPNGAGKSTLFSVIAGQYPPTHGTVWFDGHDISGLPAWRIARLGLVRAFQVARVFPDLTVRDNVEGALAARYGESRLFLRPGLSLKLRQRGDELLADIGLDALANQKARQLAQGDRKRLEIAMALAQEPRLLLLDEPTAGMSPAETGSTVQLIHHLWQEQNLTVLLTEHDMEVVFGLAHRVTVLHRGQILRAGTPQEIAQDPLVLEVYLGRETAS